MTMKSMALHRAVRQRMTATILVMPRALPPAPMHRHFSSSPPSSGYQPGFIGRKFVSWFESLLRHRQAKYSPEDYRRLEQLMTQSYQKLQKNNPSLPTKIPIDFKNCRIMLETLDDDESNDAHSNNNSASSANDSDIVRFEELLRVNMDELGLLDVYDQQKPRPFGVRLPCETQCILQRHLQVQPVLHLEAWRLMGVNKDEFMAGLSFAFEQSMKSVNDWLLRDRGDYDDLCVAASSVRPLLPMFGQECLSQQLFYLTKFDQKLSKTLQLASLSITKIELLSSTAHVNFVNKGVNRVDNCGTIKPSPLSTSDPVGVKIVGYVLRSDTQIDSVYLNVTVKIDTMERLALTSNGGTDTMSMNAETSTPTSTNPISAPTTTSTTGKAIHFAPVPMFDSLSKADQAWHYAREWSEMTSGRPYHRSHVVQFQAAVPLSTFVSTLRSSPEVFTSYLPLVDLLMFDVLPDDSDSVRLQDDPTLTTTVAGGVDSVRGSIQDGIPTAPIAKEHERLNALRAKNGHQSQPIKSLELEWKIVSLNSPPNVRWLILKKGFFREVQPKK